jgi:hypothetical protein
MRQQSVSGLLHAPVGSDGLQSLFNERRLQGLIGQNLLDRGGKLSLDFKADAWAKLFS